MTKKICPTPRQAKFLAMAAEGQPNKVIAMRMGIREQAVKNAMTRLYHRLGTRNRTEAVVMALRRGWIE